MVVGTSAPSAEYHPLSPGVAVGGTFGAWTKKVADRYGRHAAAGGVRLLPCAPRDPVTP